MHATTSMLTTATHVVGLTALAEVIYPNRGGRTLYANDTRLGYHDTTTPGSTAPVEDLVHPDDLAAALRTIKDLDLGTALDGDTPTPEGLGFAPTRVITFEEVEDAFGDPVEIDGPSATMQSIMVRAGHGTLLMDYEVKNMAQKALEGFIPGEEDAALVREYLGAEAPWDVYDAIVESDAYGDSFDAVKRGVARALVQASREWSACREVA